jgi:uncharacterized protein (DUF302 family)
MNVKLIISTFIGFVLGIVVFGITIFYSAPSLLIIEDVSPYSYGRTVQSLKDTVKEHGWKITAIRELHKAAKKAGYDIPPVSVIELCQPKHAVNILKDDENRIVTSMMPCRISIYETHDGRVIVSRLNSSLIAKMFGGTVSQVMADATKETEGILSKTLRKEANK